MADKNGVGLFLSRPPKRERYKRLDEVDKDSRGEVPLGLPLNPTREKIP